MALETGVGFLRVPATPPSMRIRTGRFVVYEEARSIFLPGKIILDAAAIGCSMLGGRLTQCQDTVTERCKLRQAVTLPDTGIDPTSNPFIRISQHRFTLLQHEAIHPSTSITSQYEQSVLQ